MNVYSYFRLSSLEQTKGDGLRRQLGGADAWCEERGLVLDSSLSLRDLGVSAFRGKHAQFGELKGFLDLVEKGTIPRGSVLLVESLDRLSREAVLDAAARLFDLIRAGITVVTLSDGQEYSEERLRTDWTPLVISLAVMARAHDESRIKSERVGKAWAQKRIKAQSELVAQTEICPGWMRKNGNHYELIEPRAEIVRGIFRDTIAGLGRRTITKALNEAKIPTWGVGKKRGSRWHDSYIQKILGNPATYGVGEPLGKVAGGDGSSPTTPITDYYPAAVDEETFFAAQASAKSRGKGSGKPAAHRNALRGIAKCGACGSNMVLVDKGARSIGPKLICGAAHASAGCDHRAYYRYATTEMTVVFGLGQQITTLTASARDQAAKVHSERAGLVSKQEALQGRLDNLIELVAAGGGGTAVASQVAKLQTEVDATGGAIKTLDREAKLAKSSEPAAASSELIDLYGRLKSLEGDALVSARAHMAQRMKALVSRVEFEPERVVIHYADGSVGGFMPVVHESRKRTADWLPAELATTVKSGGTRRRHSRSGTSPD